MGIINMNFCNWLEMAWVLGDESLQTYRRWKESASKDSKFIRVPWKKAKDIMDRMGVSNHYHDKFRKDQNIPDNVDNEQFTQWAASDFIKDHTHVVLAQVDPCKFMQLLSHHVSKVDLQDKFYVNKFQQEDVDPSLPLCLVNLDGTMLYDGNHRMASACEIKQDGYVAIAYFMSYDPVKSAVLKIVET